MGATDACSGVPSTAAATGDHVGPPPLARKACLDCSPALAWRPQSNHRSSVLEAATSAPRAKGPPHGTSRLVQVAPEAAVNESCQWTMAVGLAWVVARM